MCCAFGVFVMAFYVVIQRGIKRSLWGETEENPSEWRLEITPGGS